MKVQHFEFQRRNEIHLAEVYGAALTVLKLAQLFEVKLSKVSIFEGAGGAEMRENND